MNLLVLLAIIIFNSAHCQLIPTVIEGIKHISTFYSQQIKEERVLHDSYDFIIIGAGSAGGVLTNKLTENQNWNVLLLEAGGNEIFLQSIPTLAVSFQNTKFDWATKTEPSDTFCLGMEKHQCHFGHGKVMGGSSSINGQVWTRGNRADYNGWAELGNPGWDYESVLKYFKKLENCTVENVKVHSQYRGFSGPVTVSDGYTVSNVAKALLKGGNEFGLPHIDYNGKSQICASKFQTSLKHGARQSSNVAFLHPIRGRKNLHVEMNTLVTKLIVNELKKSVEGVVFSHNGKERKILATKEVIVSAGALKSPQLLMLSGIGPASSIASLGIKPIVNLPVGYNLIDQPGAQGITFHTNETLPDSISLLFNIKKEISSYVLRGEGFFGLPGGTEAVFFLNTKDPQNLDANPDIEIISLPGSLTSAPGIREALNIEKSVFDSTFGQLHGSSYFILEPIVLHPYSRGRVKLRSKNPYDSPKVYPNYFGDERDMKTMLRGIRAMLAIVDTPSMQKISAKLVKLVPPGCKKFVFDSDGFWECFVRMFSTTTYHYAGTCKMGPKNDDTAVVDARLKVHGISKLRVVDASIMPTMIAGK